MGGEAVRRERGGGGRTAARGFVAGVAGGLAMAAFMALAASIEGLGPLSPLRPLGDTFADSGSREGGAGVLAFGLGLHLLVAGLVGVVCAGLVPAELRPGGAAIVCMGVAFVALAIATSYVLPAWNASLLASMPRLGGSWVMAHAVYGAVVGYVGWMGRRRGRVAAREAGSGARGPRGGEPSPAASR